MPKIKTSELTGAALDWAVAEAQGISRATEAGLHTEYANPNVTGASATTTRACGTFACLVVLPACQAPA